MEGGPKSLKTGLKLDEEGREGEGTEEPGEVGRADKHCQSQLQPLTQTQGERSCLLKHGFNLSEV